MKIYVGNLSFDTSESALRDLFAEHGAVEEVRIITDRDSGRSRGFGFVSMVEKDHATSAIDTLDKREFDGRTLVVNEARPKNRDGGGGGGGGGGGRGRY